MNEQCLRQWTRIIIAQMYGVNHLDDSIIYIVLSIVLQVVLSDVDEAVKNSFRRLGTIMLRKKRLNSNITEIDRLLDGNFPTPNNGKIQDFFKYMEHCMQILGVNVQPMTLWYAMCLALNNPQLLNKQLFHCQSDIKKDDLNPNELFATLANKISKLVYHKIPFQKVLDYKCLVTLDDTSGTGGYCFRPHTNRNGSICCPVSVLSTAGHQELLNNPTSCFCPYCYLPLTADQFEPVGPKPVSSNQQIFPQGTRNFFSGPSSVPNLNTNTNTSQPYAGTYSYQSKTLVPSNFLEKKGILVIMKGCVGSGKSTITAMIKSKIESIGGRCIAVGIDQFGKTGMSFAQAKACVQAEIRKVNNFPNDGKLLVVIIDTIVGDQNEGSRSFGIDFMGWKKIEYWPNLISSDLMGYLCWSLRNVLLRQIPRPSDSFWLSPLVAGTKKCIEVHKKKARALFSDRHRIPELPISPNTPREEAIHLLAEKADAYQLQLDQKMNMDVEVEKFVSQLLF